MKKGRLEAFSDGVLAIIITIMVLEMKIPHGEHVSDLKPLLPVFISYILSFINVGLYWNNHHHLLQAVDEVNGKVLWANTHLLFWLSLLPFATGWMGENHFAQWPVILYGIDLLMCSIAYFILVKCLLKIHSKSSVFAKAIGKDKKGMISTGIYLLGISFAFVEPFIGLASYFIVLAIWFIPDKRIEEKIVEQKKDAA